MKGLAAGVGIGGVVVAGIFLANGGSKRAPETTLAAAPTGDGVAPVVTTAPTGDTIVVYKSPTCGCCGMWVTYMREQGFTVVVNEMSDDQLDRVKAANGVTSTLASCHTSLIHGYVVEGHVPAPEIRKMLAEKPRIAGLSVPGMVEGPPGMTSTAPQAYKVIAFAKDGKTTVYSTH
jgi:hypothetical protein